MGRVGERGSPVFGVNRADRRRIGVARRHHAVDKEAPYTPSVREYVPATRYH